MFCVPFVFYFASENTILLWYLLEIQFKFPLKIKTVQKNKAEKRKRGEQKKEKKKTTNQKTAGNSIK